MCAKLCFMSNSVIQQLRETGPCFRYTLLQNFLQANIIYMFSSTYIIGAVFENKHLVLRRGLVKIIPVQTKYSDIS